MAVFSGALIVADHNQVEQNRKEIGSKMTRMTEQKKYPDDVIDATQKALSGNIGDIKSITFADGKPVFHPNSAETAPQSDTK
ncbi:MAG: hypothetical protein WCJ84_06420 [Candidatus Peregrinibacteria bacterium]